MDTTIIVSGSGSPSIRQLKRATSPGTTWTKRPAKQPSGQHMRNWPPTCRSIVASRHSQRCGSRKKASNTARGDALTFD